jgi:hypothetical protein
MSIGALGTSHRIADAAAELRDSIQGAVVIAGDGAYPRIRQIWNGAVDHEPALFALCETADDVESAILIARASDCLICPGRRP